MTLNLSPYDRETVDLIAGAAVPLDDGSVVDGSELADRVRAVMAARNNAEAKIAAVEERIRHWDENLSDNETMLPRWVAMDLRMALGMSYEQASAAALDGSGVTE